MRSIIFFLLALFIFQIEADEIGSVTGYKIPRFVSLKSNDVNLRVGPSTNYPIKINYIKQNFPIEIIGEYSAWRQIKDIDGNIGWVNAPLLKGNRYGIILSKNNNAFVFNYPNGIEIGKIGNRNIVKLKKCLEEWCLISLENNKAWIKKEDLWGVHNKEMYNISFMQPLINLYWQILDVVYKKLYT